MTKADRQAIEQRLSAFARLAQAFSPEIDNKAGKMPRAPGRLRIGPDI